MNTILTIISREIRNQKARFVFPSDIASSVWARKICGLTGVRSVALNRFLAWDRFKEEIVRAEIQNKEPVSAVLRRLFAEKLIRRNAEAVKKMPSPAPGAGEGGAVSRTIGSTPGLLEEPALPFRRIIPTAYAGEGSVFTSQIAGILSSLKLLRVKQEAAQKAAGYVKDEEDLDYAVLEAEYSAFLERNGLFEPSWEKPPLRDREHDYYIFYPEAMEDFIEYEKILTLEPNIHLISLNAEAGDQAEPQVLYRYSSFRQEIHAVVLEILKAHEEGVPYEEMAINAPGLEDLEPYLLRELSLFNIPVRRRSGRPLAEYGTGKLFSLISACKANDFSFSSLKSLLLNDWIPWRDPKQNKDLIDFGIKNNCVSSYQENGVLKDVWLEAFKGADREKRLRGYYEGLKADIEAMTGAKKFIDIRNHYFAFRGNPWEKPFDGEKKDAGSSNDGGAARPVRSADDTTVTLPGFLSRNSCSDEGDAVLARCVEELSALIQLEEQYPDLAPEKPFMFFLSALKEKQYVTQQHSAGVNIFPYRVAAASPYTCHFVLNAAQNAATVLYQSLKFLRQDKRKKLGLTQGDTDASRAFFRLYRLGPWKNFSPRLRISASDQTISGNAIPHSFFAGENFSAVEYGGKTVPALLQPPDAYAREKAFWAAADSSVFPEKLFPVQKAGFLRWQKSVSGQDRKRQSLLAETFPQNSTSAVLLRECISREQLVTPIEPEGRNGEKRYFKVSATGDLNVFFNCPAFWLYSKIFALSEEPLEAQLMDDTSLGILYHQILKDLFARIRKQDKVFKPERLETYRKWIQEITEEDARTHPAFQGPLAIPLVTAQAKAIAGVLAKILNTETCYFSGYTVTELESKFNFYRDDIFFKGIIDRISVSPDDSPVIIDYKTNKTPTKDQSAETADSPLEDFQMPMYIKLYEENTGVRVEEAVFFSIYQNNAVYIIGGKKGFTRDEYQETLDAFDGYVNRFKNSVEALDFSPPQIDINACTGCVFRTVCRTTYTPNAAHLPHTKARSAGVSLEANHAE
ncbi:MAG: PD-(D/E)XK nuclease family protein [Treponema sp.]|nr:PD-(D/E)XK nuclease family protein [Treponema sp.]